MNNHDPQAAGSSLTLPDVYYIIFRHKWKILSLTAIGLVAAALVYWLKRPVYSSEAELFIRYVVESKVPSAVGGDSQVRSPDPAGANIINSEIEIIKSLDLAKEVVESIGAEKILGKGGGDTNKSLAAAMLKNGLLVDVPAHSDILRIVFQHPNPEIVQPVLSQLISAYMRKHAEIHSSAGTFDDLLTQQTDALRAQLAQTEADLRRAKTNVGLLDVAEAKKANAEEISRIREMLYNTQAELAARQAALKERQKLMPTSVASSSSTNSPDAAVPVAKIEEYKRLCESLGAFRKHEQELLAQFTEENSLVRSVRQQIASAEQRREEMERAFPKLVQVPVASTEPSAPVRDWSDEETQITALQAKLNVLTAQWERVNAEAKTLNELEPTITELERKKDLEETKYRHFSTSLEQARFDEALTAGKMSNISIAQNPSPPVREARQLVKILAMIVGGGVGSGVGLAFLLELFVDPTVRRPGEVETRLHLPLFLSIPDARRNGHLALAEGAPGNGQPSAVAQSVATPAASRSGLQAPGNEVVAWHPNDTLHSYHEALRDRLVAAFEAANLTRKPKLVGVTGCATGAGVTTVATGLAASLSETGDGNVLLVDMTAGHGAAHAFFRGKPACDLADALEGEKRDGALVQENLYVVAEGGNGEKLSRVLPRRFHNLVPKLKASDYDYIIFDLPPVSQISITPRLAGFMDMMLMVIESEKTDREVVKRATALLGESKAPVSAVLNKTRRYVPKALHQEL